LHRLSISRVSLKRLPFTKTHPSFRWSSRCCYRISRYSGEHFWSGGGCHWRTNCGAI